MKIRNIRNWYWYRIAAILWTIFIVVWLILSPRLNNWLSIVLIIVNVAIVLFIFGVLIGRAWLDE